MHIILLDSNVLIWFVLLDSMSTKQQIEEFDYENALKSAFFTLREIPDRNNKLESIKAELMDLIAKVQNGEDGVFSN